MKAKGVKGERKGRVVNWDTAQMFHVKRARTALLSTAFTLTLYCPDPGLIG